MTEHVSPPGLRSAGAVQGQQVSFEYQPDDPKSLHWRSQTTSHEGHVDGADVIGLIPLHNAQVNGFSATSTDTHTHERREVGAYTLLTAQQTKDPADTKVDGKSTPIFASLPIENPPEAFLREHLIAQPPAHLSVPRNSDGSPNLHIVISTLSGTGLALSIFADLVKPTLLSAGIAEDDYQVHETQSAETVTDLTCSTFLPRANEGIRQTIILLSGDGGVSDAINVLCSATAGPNYVKPTIGLLTLGTGNALGNSTGIAQGSTLGLANLLKGSPTPLPLFLAQFSLGAERVVDEGRRSERFRSEIDGEGAMYGAVVCSWGFHAALVADSDTTEYRKFGAQRFQMAAKEELFPSNGEPPHRYKAKVSLINKAADGTDHYEVLDRQEHMYVLTTMVSTLERGFTISPSSKPLDGQIRVVHFGPMSGDEAMRVMGLAYQGGLHIHDEVVSYEDVEGVRIDFDEREKDGRWRRVCIDGRIIRVEEGGYVEVRRLSRQVVDLVFAG
ncbi:MAG: hypothetical protein M1819_001658 [Sarea resinae]|nr:MAG: hypothetical protein M1819_001658 [Sarea resinae]